MELANRVALVTGGAGGIGAAVARNLAALGAAGVVINYRSSARQAEELAHELGPRALAIRADVANDDEVRKMVAAVGDRFGRLDLLINNAGVTRWVDLSNLEGLTDGVWDEILDVNVKGAFRCARAAAPLLKATSGMIVNVASISGILAPATMSSLAYGTAKAALIYMTRALAVALAPEVRVNAVAPAFTDTPWMSGHFGAAYPEIIATASTAYPLRRIARPEDVASAIIGLVTGGDFVTGQTLVVDGGLSLT
ncbi:MAG TPA: SDR family oxidoreductase [Candidatus Eisenbacteria bacterium]|nr:SDR family oxidoreductase [Candidatus Eisenbacteria bacterium]